MANQFREVTTTSFGKRIINSFVGIIIGVILFVASFPLIFWNEGRSVKRIRTLDEGRNLVISTSAEEINTNNNNALIHISGNATTNDVLQDTYFGVQETALKLKRTVEMYQWKETKHTKTEKNLGGSETTATTYSYDTTWEEDRIDSTKFRQRAGHENPTTTYKSVTYSAASINVGAFKLGTSFIKQLDKFESYPLSQQNYDAMDSRLKKSFKLYGDTYFYGNPENPQIGSLRISYQIIKPSEISVVGKQENNIIQTYYTKNGDINLLADGNISADGMFTDA